jgi:hypothetical protein
MIIMDKIREAVYYLKKYHRYENKNLLELLSLLNKNGFKDDHGISFSLNDINKILSLINKEVNGYKKPSIKNCGIIPDANPCGDANEY